MISASDGGACRIGLTGARGVLGRSLQRDWPQPGWQPFPGDVRSVPALSDWLAQSGPLAGVIHCAAMVPTARVQSQPLDAFQVNAGGTCNLLEAVRRLPREQQPWLFCASSSHVYASSVTALREDAPLRPVSLYGLTKLQGEQCATAYQEHFQLRVCVGRIFSFSSPLQAESYFIPALVRKIFTAPRGAVLRIPGLQGTRDFLTTAEIGRAIRLLFEQRASGVFNIASGRSVRLLDVALAIRRRLNREDVQIEAPDEGTVHLNADIEKLRQAGITPHLDFDALLDGILGETPK